MSNLFEKVEVAAPDPILGIQQLVKADDRAEKVDLSIGIYHDEAGHIPMLNVVQEASARLTPAELGGSYLPMEGLHSYLDAVKKLVFGEKIAERVATVQSLGGTGALRYGADFLKRYYPHSTFYASKPTWGNHFAIFGRAGFKTAEYPYYDEKTKGVDFEGLTAALKQMQSHDIVLFHGCCHNPTGVDLTLDEWQEVIKIIKEKELILFIDFAYQGFGAGIEEDAAPIRACAEAGLQFFVSNSFSKNFSLYRRRIGALSVVCNNAEEANRVFTQLKTDIRANISSTPVDGAAIVSTVLNDPDLKSRWEKEVAEMRERIALMRKLFVEALTKYGVGDDFQHLLKQRGMFSFSGLTKEEVEKLQWNYGVYAVFNGRLCMAALRKANIDYAAKAVAEVWKERGR